MKETTKEKSPITPLLVVDGESEQNTTSILPDDIIVDILLRLPAKSILRFRCVCKYWYSNLLGNTGLVKIHLKNSIKSDKFNVFSIKDGREFNMLTRKSSSPSFEDDYFEPMNVIDFPLKSELVKNPNLRMYTHGSCNGLILMKRHIVRIGYGIDNNPFLWNPTTKEFKEIVIEKHVDYGEQYDPITIIPRYGVGYNCDTDDYKIVKVELVYSSHDRFLCVGSGIQVYSLRSDSWKTLPGTVLYEIVHHDNVFVNGALYWIATPYPLPTDRLPILLIVSFDIEGEIFQEVPLTAQVRELFGSGYLRGTLGVLGGCLCVVFCDYSEFEVWVMKDRKMRESWTKLFISELPVEKPPRLCWMKLQWEFQNGKLLFTVQSDNVKDNYFVIYDSVRHKSEVPDAYRIKGNNCSTKIYVESLVPIFGTYAGREQHDPILQKQEQAVSKYLIISNVAVTSLMVGSYVAAIFLVMHISSLLMHLF